MPNIGPMEIGIVLIIALVVFGPKRLPDLGHSLGKGIREFKGSIGDDGPAEPMVAEAPVAEPKATEAAVAEPVAAEPVVHRVKTEA
jgi:sec-independent protein translocase protein TatA